jgi:hypothetical protein
MAERFVFPLRFEESEMREAVNAFTRRALLAEQPLKTLAPAALILFACVMLALSSEEENAALLLIGALAVLGGGVYGGWRMHQRAMREKVERARGYFSTARLLDEGVVIDAGAQPGEAPLLPWKSIKAVWPAPDALLLIVATNHFIALPTARAPKEALEFLMGKVGAEAAA